MIRATDALASVDGCRVLVQLSLQHLFCMNVCQHGPECNISTERCQDLLGSSATAEGGDFRS